MKRMLSVALLVLLVAWWIALSVVVFASGDVIRGVVLQAVIVGCTAALVLKRRRGRP